MGNLPYFQFYVDDWLSSSRIDTLTAEQERGYLRLLLRSWGMPDCTLTTDESHLLKWSLMTDADALRTLMRTFFERTNKGWRNAKLYELWLHAQSKHISASKNANHRWNKGNGSCKGISKRICDGNAIQNQNHINKILYSQDSPEYTLSMLLLTLIKQRNPNHKEPNIQAWSKDMHKIIHTDQRPAIEVERIIRWCQQDEFWQNNILSPSKLGKQFDQLALRAGPKKEKSTREGLI